MRAGALSTIADDSHEDSSSSSSDNDSEQAGRPELLDGSSDEDVETISAPANVTSTAPPKAKKPTQQSKHTDESSSDDECESGAKGTSGAQAPVVAKSEAPRPECMPCDHLFDHRVYSQNCKSCVRAAKQRERRPHGTLAMGPKPKKCGQHVTGDHLIGRRGDTSEAPVDLEDSMYPGAKHAVVMHDRATGWTACYPKATKSGSDTLQAFQHFAGADDKVSEFYSDGSRELATACKQAKWRPNTSTPGIPKNNGLIERIVRRTKEGARKNLCQSGLPKSWWAHAITHHCSAWNIAVHDGESCYNARHNSGHCQRSRYLLVP